MSEAIHTRQRALEADLQQLKDNDTSHKTSITQLQTSLSSIQSELTDLKTSIAAIPVMKTSLAELTTLLLRLPSTTLFGAPHTESSSQPPFVLSSPTTHHLPFTQPKSSTNHSSLQVRPPRCELTSFDGTNNLEWIFQAKRYFESHQVSEDQKIDLASFYMSGQALVWFTWMHKNRQLSSWLALTTAIEDRFGSSCCANPRSALFKLNQTETVTEYQTTFETLSNRDHDLSPAAVLDCFLSGLRLEIQHEVLPHQPRHTHYCHQPRQTHGNQTFQSHLLLPSIATQTTDSNTTRSTTLDISPSYTTSITKIAHLFPYSSSI